MAPVAAEHFVVGDFFVSQPSATCRFDEELTLKEDYTDLRASTSTRTGASRCATG